MTRKNLSTFEPWLEYEEDKEPVTINKEILIEENYQSTYVTYYNHLMDAGWKKEKNKWISPRHPEDLYLNIWAAHQAQDLFEIQQVRRKERNPS